ncbi:YcnI family copper-binding membrane protein [Paenibacillus xanthanilyticus]|uniref:YcnI family protein n=1 Tax=Paenibacillus xanthanilyticus TaxID=1783531 RepID=A0ABV8JXT6_9BACL
MAKWGVGAIVAFALMVLLAGTASAHVTVLPNETTRGAYEVFTVRVPTELESETTKVELLFPEGVEISRVQPLGGWSYTFGTETDGSKSSIVWTAEGAGLKNGEFGEFKLQGKVADDAQELVWKAVQTYANGSVVEWAGEADAETPASVTQVLEGTGEAGHHGASGDRHPAGSSESASAGSDGLLKSPLFYLSLAALGAGLVALSLALGLRRRKQLA